MVPNPMMDPDNERETGTVVSFSHKSGGNGYGFIKPDGGGKDVFVHLNSVRRSGLEVLGMGTRVSYVLMPDREPGKFSAEKLRLIEASS